MSSFDQQVAMARAQFDLKQFKAANAALAGREVALLARFQSAVAQVYNNISSFSYPDDFGRAASDTRAISRLVKEADDANRLDLTNASPEDVKVQFRARDYRLWYLDKEILSRGNPNLNRYDVNVDDLHKLLRENCIQLHIYGGKGECKGDAAQATSQQTSGAPVPVLPVFTDLSAARAALRPTAVMVATPSPPPPPSAPLQVTVTTPIVATSVVAGPSPPAALTTQPSPT